MKAKEVHELSDEALVERAGQLRESLFRLRFKLALGNQDTVRQIRTERKDLARVKNELRSREVVREVEAGERPARHKVSRFERKVRTARRLRGAALAAKKTTTKTA